MVIWCRAQSQHGIHLPQNKERVHHLQIVEHLGVVVKELVAIVLTVRALESRSLPFVVGQGTPTGKALAVDMSAQSFCLLDLILQRPVVGLAPSVGEGADLLRHVVVQDQLVRREG